MFSGFFLLIVGLVMASCTVLGFRRGRIMTMRKSETENTAQWAVRGDDDFLPYSLVWFSVSAFLVYQGLRLMLLP